jgi:sugar phosphate isomerase/epimerase
MAISRRRFVKAGAGAVIGAAVLKSTSAVASVTKPRPLGIQLYTVRDQLKQNFDGTLRDVHSAGFVEVEAAGYYGRTAPQFKQAVESAGLKCVSVHHPLPDLLAKGDELIQYVHDLGASYLICSSPRAQDPSRKDLTLDDWKWNAEQFNKLGEKTKPAGLQFGYHNHVHEFAKLDGGIGYDELLRATDPNLVTLEMDCGWVAVGGYQPAEYLKKYPNRFSLLHVKEMVIGKGEPHSTVLGRGSIDYAPIFAAATNVQHYFYEQEEFDTPPMEALKTSADYLRKANF